MVFKKISLHNREIVKSYKVKLDAKTSFWNDEFNSGWEGAFMNRRRIYGVSKAEYRVSARSYVNGYLAKVDGEV